ncbi:hypothetical protein DERF_014539 [Dermatophagoides farinae]|uniref:Uncharacterized protein n=1 Tax=Dermatophagoides farinae TaxID=6954 RepID=A0A922KUJ6_DERFA|nr:hypothetical protein DERF_014539 [Dermatophagoides farinae]
MSGSILVPVPVPVARNSIFIRSNSSIRLAAIITCAPCSKAIRAISLPRPDDAPVTQTDSNGYENENDEESVQVQTLTANIAEIANGIGRDGFEQIESSDIQELLESQDEDLTETDLEEMLNSQPIEEKASTSTGNVTFNLKV